MRFVSIFILLVLFFLGGCSQANERLFQPSKTKAADARRILGLAYLEQGNLALARRNLQRAISYMPYDYRNHLGMALYLQQIEEDDAALQRYQQLLIIAPDNQQVMHNYGAFLCYLGQYGEAQSVFNQLIENVAAADISDSLETSGYCYLDAGYVEQARTQLMRALRWQPDKGLQLLAKARGFYDRQQHTHGSILLDIYQNALPVSAESLRLNIYIAALEQRFADVEFYGQQLARDFSQSEQYRQFLAHEY